MFIYLGVRLIRTSSKILTLWMETSCRPNLERLNFQNPHTFNLKEPLTFAWTNVKV